MILWLDPFSGLSGDMLLGALLDLGAPLDAVREAVASTGLTGWSLEAERVDAGGLQATQAVITDHEHDDHGHRHDGRGGHDGHGRDDEHPHRPASVLLGLVDAARPAPVAAVAGRAVRLLAEVEGRLHGVDPADVHLHEVGGVDTVVDVVGVAAALHALGIDEVHCSPPVVGSGTVRSAHGVLPVPAPATARLLEGFEVRGDASGAELVTPTGAALLRAIGAQVGPLPPVRIERVGYGAGTRALPDRANVLPAVLGTRVGAVQDRLVLETNVDDVTGEVLGHVVQALLAAGADDAWVSPIVMKKGRPAHTVHVLAAPERAALLEAKLLSETGSLGVRRIPVARVALAREMVEVDVDGYTVRVKVGPHGAKPEHDDVVAAAAALGLPVREVARRAAEAARLA